MYNQIFVPENSKIKKMGLAKLSAILGASLNVFLYVFAWAANLDNIKSGILFIVALAMSLYRFYRWGINSIQNKELKDIRIKKEALELKEQELQHREREAKLNNRKTN